jgi:hypothetical protein
MRNNAALSTKAWTFIALLMLGTGAFAQGTPNMPAHNPWLTDSVYPTSHFNPGATDSVLFAGRLGEESRQSGN